MKNILNLFIRHQPFKMIIAILLAIVIFAINNQIEFPYADIAPLIPLCYVVLVIIIGLGYAIKNMVNDANSTYRKITVKPGHHYPSFFSRFNSPILYFGKKDYIIERHFKFVNESVFNFDSSDQMDWSKLFGLSFGHHQKNDSYRFGFRFVGDKLQVSPYIYQNGVRLDVFPKVTLKLNQTYKFKIIYLKETNQINFMIKRDDDKQIYSITINIMNKIKNLGYSLGLYIGGNKAAPMNLIFYRKRK